MTSSSSRVIHERRLKRRTQAHQNPLVCPRSLSCVHESVRPIYVLSCEDLILHKLLAGRIIDRADVIALIASNHRVIDRDYLRQWALRLGLDRDLAKLWTEALPGELDP